MPFCNLHRINNDQLTLQIIITETSMSDHNRIQIEPNIKIVEEKQNHQINKSKLSNRHLNFFNEDISWASIDADMLNTSWDMLLTDVNTDEMYKIIINICMEICKKHVLPKKSSRNTKYPETEGLWWEKYQNFKRKYRGQQIIELRKCTKSDKINLKQLKNFDKYRKKSKRNESYCWYQIKPQILLQIRKNNLTIRAGIGPLQHEEGNLKPSKKKRICELLDEQYNSVFSTPVPTMTIKYPNDLFRHPQANTLSDINITREDIIDAIKTISQNSSGGPDEFPAILLKQCSKSLAHHLQLLYKVSLKTGEMIIDLKRAIITPIYKSGSRNLIKNYHPVVLTSLKKTWDLLTLPVESSISRFNLPM